MSGEAFAYFCWHRQHARGIRQISGRQVPDLMMLLWRLGLLDGPEAM